MPTRRRLRLSSLFIPAVVLVIALPARGERPREHDVAQRADALLAKALPTSKAAKADDATFLRRASIDLTGKLPEPEEVRRFVADADPDKRAKIIERLLSSDA